MPNYKLYYLDGRGRAELSRLIFAAVGQEYEDVRYSAEEWKHHKTDFQFGQLPVLEVDGIKVAQSIAIAHYLAVQHGLAGITALDHFKAHALVEAVRDITEPLGHIIWYEEVEERKAKLTHTYFNVTLKNALVRLNKHLQDSSSGFLLADVATMTYADLALYDGLSKVNDFAGRDVTAEYPHVAKLYKAVEEHPQISAYLAKRKVTPF